MPWSRSRQVPEIGAALLWRLAAHYAGFAQSPTTVIGRHQTGVSAGLWVEDIAPRWFTGPARRRVRSRQHRLSYIPSQLVLLRRSSRLCERRQHARCCG